MPEANNDFIWTVVGDPRAWPVVWLALINLVTFFVFGWDKFKAKYKEKHDSARRVPERTLFLLAILGGSAGALLGMKIWRHKTLHKTFTIGIPVIMALQILIPVGLWLYRIVL